MVNGSAKGNVTRIYPDQSGCYIRLNDSTNVPKDGYFRLHLNHPNYNALFSLTVAALTNGLPLSIVTEKEIHKSEHATVVYMVLDS